jgi:hypothetical protein
MSTRNDYGADQWKAIAGAPVAAGLLMTLADPSGVMGITKEALAAGRAISDSAGAETPEVVRSIAESVKSAGGRPELPDVPRGDRAKTTEALLAVIKTAVAAVETKSPAEAAPFKTWLVSVATKVAHASKEGGFLGFGGTQVSEDEQAALKSLADTLGVKPSQV